jgi:tetratricopeptide (TPR) repeat protein
MRLKELPSILLALFSSVISALAFSFLFPLNNSLIILFVLIFSLAFAVAVMNRQEKVKQFTFSFQASARENLTLAGLLLFVSASVVVMFAMGFKIYLADVYAKESLGVSSIEGKIEKLNKAISMAPDRDIYYIALANNYMALANNKVSSGGNQTEVSDNLNASIRNVKKALELSPNNVINNESLALIYENTSYYIGGGIVEWIKSLEDAYNKVIELDPNNPTPYFRLALINVARSNIESDQSEKARYINEAIKNYDKALAKKGNLSEAYYGKGVAYEKLSNLNEAIEQLKSAVYNSGQNIDYIFELGRLYFNRGVLNGSPLGGSETASSTKKRIVRNDDINTAEQVFLNIIQANQYHANAQYSLALLYKTIGETEKARVVYEKLLSILQDEKQKESVREQFKDLY